MIMTVFVSSAASGLSIFVRELWKDNRVLWNACLLDRVQHNHKPPGESSGIFALRRRQSVIISVVGSPLESMVFSSDTCTQVFLREKRFLHHSARMRSFGECYGMLSLFVTK